MPIKSDNWVHRTSAGIKALAYSAKITEQPDYGVKGPSILHSLQNFDAVTSNILDYMHGVCIGIVKSTMKLMVSAYSKTELQRIDERIGQIRFSTNITSTVPHLKDRDSWKAKDLRNFLLYVVFYKIAF